MKKCSFPSRVLLTLLDGYKRYISPYLGDNCRFVPSCSEYMMEAVECYGFFRGGAMGLLRLCRCGPWHKGGYDPVPAMKKGR